jgi:hypothetical protein
MAGKLAPALVVERTTERTRYVPAKRFPGSMTNGTLSASFGETRPGGRLASVVTQLHEHV